MGDCFLRLTQELHVVLDESPPNLLLQILPSGPCSLDRIHLYLSGYQLNRAAVTLNPSSNLEGVTGSGSEALLVTLARGLELALASASTTKVLISSSPYLLLSVTFKVCFTVPTMRSWRVPHLFQPECSRPSIVRRDNIVFARKQTQLKIALECECSTIYFSPSPWRVYG